MLQYAFLNGIDVNDLLIFFCVIFVLTGIVDIFIVKQIFRKTGAQYFVLHSCFNVYIMILCTNECWETMLNPLDTFSPLYSISSLSTTVAIGAFHCYHTLLTLRFLGGKGLSFEDLVHHFVSGIIVPIFGVSLPFGKVVSIVNFFMCGLPGGIDYVLLSCVKYGLIKRLTEKRVNRMLNLTMRLPGMQLCCYIIFINFKSGNLKATFIELFLMSFAAFLHCFNAVYYADKVVQNYGVCLYKEKVEKKTS